MTNFKQQVTDYLNANRDICEELMYDEGYTKNWSGGWDGPFDYKSVDSYGGEGQGSDYWTVILVSNPINHDEQYYIKFQGWYASYNGAEYENWSFVEPKQKTITIYS